MTEPILVVDLGIALTKVALVIDGADTVLSNPAEPTHAWPTSIALDGSEFVIGTAANSHGQGSTRGRFLQLLGQADEIELGGRSLHGPELVKQFLSKLRDRAEQQDEGPVDRILLTVPDDPAKTIAELPVVTRRWIRRPARSAPSAVGTSSALHGARIDRELIEAARKAGFVDVELLSRSAAVIEAARSGGRLEADGYVLVCDAGASALRLSLVRTEVRPAEVLAWLAIDGLGGDGLDHALAANIRKQTGDSKSARPGGASDEPGLEPALLELAREIREHLTANLVFERLIDAEILGGDRADLYKPVRYTREDLARLLWPALHRLEASCIRLLGHVSPSSLSGVLLIGGAATPDFLAQTLTNALKVRVRCEEQADLVCLRGGIEWAKAATSRRTQAANPPAGVRPLAWPIDSDQATFMRWLVDENEGFGADQRIGRIRDFDDTVLELTADCAGHMLQHCARKGDPVKNGTVLAIVRQHVESVGDLRFPPRFLRELIDEERRSERFVTFSGDGDWLVTAGADGTLRVRSTATGRAVPGMVSQRPIELPSGRHRCDAALGADGRWVSAVSDGATVRLHDVETGQRLQGSFKSAPVRAVWLSTDASRVSAAADAVCVWQVDGRKLFAVGHGVLGDPAKSVAFSADGDWLAMLTADAGGFWSVFTGRAARTKRLSVWNVPSGQQVMDQALPADGSETELSVTIAADGTRLLLTSDSTAQVFDVSSGQVTWQTKLEGFIDADFALGGAVLATISGRSGRTVGLWDPAAGRAIHAPFDVGMTYDSVRLSPDSRYLAAGGPTDAAIWALVP